MLIFLGCDPKVATVRKDIAVTNIIKVRETNDSRAHVQAILHCNINGDQQFASGTNVRKVEILNLIKR